LTLVAMLVATLVACVTIAPKRKGIPPIPYHGVTYVFRSESASDRSDWENLNENGAATAK